jgi:peroxiredoxin-like protein
MSIVKDFRFPVSIQWEGGQTGRAIAPEKPELAIATPPEFRGGVAGRWSPEELLVGAAASCYTVTLAAVLAAKALPLHRLSVHGAGHVTRLEDGRLGFIGIELEADIVTGEAAIAEVEQNARRVEQMCLVARALDVPVHVKVFVSALDEAREPAPA